eukprot:5907679-Pyramimonas_sp.AAC.1
MMESWNGEYTWARCNGPLSAVALSLHRVDWKMVSAHVLYDDQGTLVNLLTTTPWDVKLSLRQSIGRWQMLRIVSHMQPI